MSNDHSGSDPNNPWIRQADLRRARKDLPGEIAISPQILEQLRKGSQEAFTEIYSHYYRPIYKFLICLTRSDQDAEDIAQEIFANVWLRREQVLDVQNFKSYLYAIAKFSSIKFFRKKYAADNFHQYAENINLSELAADSNLVAEDLQMYVEYALSCMERGKAKMRAKVFRMHYQEGKSYEEIAFALGMTRSDVSSHIYNVRKDLSKLFSMLIVLFFS